MIKMDFRTLAEETNGRLVNDGGTSTIFKGVSIDSRTVKEGQLFIAVKGENDDGHKYIKGALEKKIAGIVISKDYTDTRQFADKVPIVVVEDTHQAMIQLALRYRRKTKARIVAVTGSNGKTTTKELVYSVIKRKCKNCYRSPGNFNNLFGLPLAILAMPPETEYGVFELGISVPGEMTELSNIARPDLAIITNIGPTHLETLKTVQGVAEAKFELIDAMSEENTILLNADDPVLMQTAGKRKKIYATYGIDNNAIFTARRAGLSKNGFPLIIIEDAEIEVRLFGDYQAYNILVSYAAGKLLGLNIKPDELNHLEYNVEQYRGQIENYNGLTIIADCYNANPVSMKVGLQSLRGYFDHKDPKSFKGFVVIGDMLELRDKAVMYHNEIGALLAELDFDMVLVVGPLSSKTCQSALENGISGDKINHFADAETAGWYLLDNLTRGDVIYLKGSRGMALEKVITLINGLAFREN